MKIRFSIEVMGMKPKGARSMLALCHTTRRIISHQCRRPHLVKLAMDQKGKELGI